MSAIYPPTWSTLTPPFTTALVFDCTTPYPPLVRFPLPFGKLSAKDYESVAYSASVSSLVRVMQLQTEGMNRKQTALVQ